MLVRRSYLSSPISVAVALWALPGLIGCSHELESAKPSIDRLEPNLVCNGQRTAGDASLTVHGAGFSPLPTSVLDLPETLVLPELSLTRTQDLVGESAGGARVVFEGTPSDAGLSGNLSWQSQEEMTFVVSDVPTVSLEPGVYDVQVDNPDGQMALLEKGLAVVPPPRLDAVEPVPAALCTDQSDRTLSLSGAAFLRIDDRLPTITLTIDGAPADFSPDEMTRCEDIPGTFGGGTASLCTEMTVTLPQGMLQPGAYAVTVTSPAPADCASSEEVTVVIVPPPFVSQIVPPALCIDQGDQELVIEGQSFLHIEDRLPEVSIAGGSEALALTPSLSGCTPVEGVSDVESCDTLTVTVAMGILPFGDYSVTVTNPDHAGCSSSEDIGLTISAPPEVQSVAPSTVCSGGSRLKAVGDHFAEGAKISLSCDGGNKIIETVAIESQTTTELQGILGPGIEDGEVCDVIVQNPDGCQDRPLPHQTVTGTEGPLMFFADPYIVYNGVPTGVTVFATTITAPLPAMPITLVPTGEAEPRTELSATIVPGYPNRAQFTVPVDQAAGVYDIIMEDDSGCFAVLAEGLTVTDQADLTLDAVRPSYVHTAEATAITITRGGSVAFTETPRGFLNPSTAGAIAIPLEFVAMNGDDTLTAVVPAGTPVDTYELIIVNPSGEVGVLSDGVFVVADAPPTVNDVTPQSMVNQVGQSITVKGDNFDAAATVALTCRQPNGNDAAATTTTDSVTCDADGCEASATVDAGGLMAPGTLCVVRVTNPDGAFDDYSGVGVTGSSLNLPNPTAGEAMGTARRALVASSVKATRAARFVYAIGGDGGSGAAAAPFDTVEWAPVSVYGEMRAWRDNAESLMAPRSFAAGATIGRYVYVFGGSDGTNALATGERAMILTPEESPTVQDVDLALENTGLDPGRWSYRISAVFDGNDPDNPLGETLPSEVFTIRVPDLGDRRIQVTISWSAPLNSEGTPLQNVDHYRIYRTAMANDSAQDVVLLGTVAAGGALEFTDDASGTPMVGQKPLPLGSTGVWHGIPNLNTARNGPAAAVVRDPGNPDQWIIYALAGKDAGTETGGAGLDDYESLVVSVASDGRQTTSAWTAGGLNTMTEARWQLGAWAVDSVTSSLVTAPDAYVYVGGGMDGGGGLRGDVQVAKVMSGGGLDVWVDDVDPGGPEDVTNMSAPRAGFGNAAANGQLFIFGGSSNGAKSDARAAKVNNPAPTLTGNSWNNEGLSMNDARYLMGSAVESALIFLIGGEDQNGNALSSTESVIW